MYKKYFQIFCYFLLISIVSVPLKAQQNTDENIEKAFADISGKIQNSHPRVFINKRILSDIKIRSVEKLRGEFDKMKNRVDKEMKKEIIFVDLKITDGTQSKDHEYGLTASDAALIYLVTGEYEYFEYTKKVLKKLGEYYNLRNVQKLNIHWYAYSRICALSAYDWIYSELTPNERVEIGKPLLNAMKTMIYQTGRKLFPRENTGNYKTGYYGPPALAWYAGLVFHKTGIDDNLAKELLQKGFQEHWRLLKYRQNVASDDGGASTAVMEYAIQAYPWAEFNFFHSVNSATGIDISQQWTFPLDFLYYVSWNWLPGARHFGYGDVDHFSNNLPLRHMYIHLQQLKHFYQDKHPEAMSLLNWIAAKTQQQSADAIPFAKYLLKDNISASSKKPSSTESLSNLPPAMHFENMGQIFMRSGAGDNDTYAMFSAGGILDQHRHYDNNNFVIYKKGFRTVDSGTRPEPGQHLTHYYCRTVAHNSILIRMPGEEFPKYWGGPASAETPLPIPNDGGQRKIIGSTVVGYSQNNQYVYVASDATEAYHKDKAATVLRQFLFIQPDVFVVFDKVVSKSADYKKTWLLHTVAEPNIIKNNEFFEESNGGKLFCRTVFPVEGELTKIGGPGKQFWSDGRNWPLPILTPDDWNYRKSRSKVPLDTIPLLGQWRIEVTPKTPKLKDSFLHLIQTGDNSLNRMISSKAIEMDGKKGVEFVYQGKSYQILFFDNDSIGGNIRISKGKKILLDEAFTTKVEPQKSIFQNTQKTESVTDITQ